MCLCIHLIDRSKGCERESVRGEWRARGGDKEGGEGVGGAERRGLER